MLDTTKILSGFMGVCVGDAWGVPVEFSPRHPGSTIWCLLNSSSYAESVLKAVNLGGDTDTTAAVTGGLAGIYYGIENIPPEWVEQTARKQDIIDLSHRFAAVVSSRS